MLLQVSYCLGQTRLRKSQTSWRSSDTFSLRVPQGQVNPPLCGYPQMRLVDEFRWFQITAKATASDADSIVRLVRARQPTPASRIGLVVDDINSANSSLWDVLIESLRGLPEVFVLGSMRTENIHLIANQSDTEFVQVNLNERLAENVWKKLASDSRTMWLHWREPFEQSENLMLEYVHILTQGEQAGSSHKRSGSPKRTRTSD